MASNVVNMPIKRVMRDCTLTVRLTELSRYRIRRWIASRVLCCLQWVLGCRIIFEGEDEPDA
jgi:hypothetical protein